jgi:hypothetical protein
MPLRESVSLKIPYTANEKQFLVLAVQIAVRTFRSLGTDRAGDPLSLSSPRSSESSPASANQPPESMYKSHP